MTFGELLRRLREQRGMTLRELGEAAGQDYIALNKVELGYLSAPRLDAILALTDALNKKAALSASEVEQLLDLAAQPNKRAEPRYTQAELDRIKDSSTGHMFFRSVRSRRR